MRAIRLEELKDWEVSGATWRTLELGPQQATIELRSCTGEAMDQVVAEDRQVLDFIRAARLR